MTEKALDGTGIFTDFTVQPRWILTSVETHLILQFSRPNCLRNGSKSPWAERTIGHRSSSGITWEKHSANKITWEKHSANEAFNIFQHLSIFNPMNFQWLSVQAYPLQKRFLQSRNSQPCLSCFKSSAPRPKVFAIHQLHGHGSKPMVPYLGGWTPIYHLFWCSLGARVLTHCHIASKLLWKTHLQGDLSDQLPSALVEDTGRRRLQRPRIHRMPQPVLLETSVSQSFSAIRVSNSY